MGGYFPTKQAIPFSCNSLRKIAARKVSRCEARVKTHLISLMSPGSNNHPANAPNLRDVAPAPEFLNGLDQWLTKARAVETGHPPADNNEAN